MKKIIEFMNLLLVVIFLSSLLSGKLSAQNSEVNKESELYKDFTAEFAWEAKVKIGEALPVGKSKHGIRNVIPITGGTFSGPKIKGEILPVGADWQLIRPDADTELNARYLLKTDDGYILQVINKVLIHNSADEPAYIKSVIDLEAPAGSPYEYLNHSIFLGTLEIPEIKPGEEPYVIIRVYRLL